MLVEHGIPYKKVHDLAYLAQLLPPAVPRFDQRDLDFLSAFAVVTRYPDDLVLPSTSDAERAVEIAARVVAAVEALLS